MFLKLLNNYFDAIAFSIAFSNSAPRKFLAIIFQTMKKSGHTFKSFSHLDLIKNTARITKAELDSILQDSAFVEFYNTFHP